MIELFRKKESLSPAFLEDKRQQEMYMFSLILAFPDKDNQHSQ